MNAGARAGQGVDRRTGVHEVGTRDGWPLALHALRADFAAFASL